MLYSFNMIILEFVNPLIFKPLILDSDEKLEDLLSFLPNVPEASL